MTADEAILKYDLLYPNALAYEHKLALLARLDKRVYEDVFSKYEGCGGYSPRGCGQGFSGDTALLIRSPYDDLYIKFLAAETDLLNCDIARYNNSAAVFNAAFNAFRNAYNRTHRWAKIVTAGDIS